MSLRCQGHTAGCTSWHRLASMHAHAVGFAAPIFLPEITPVAPLQSYPFAISSGSKPLHMYAVFWRGGYHVIGKIAPYKRTGKRGRHSRRISAGGSCRWMSRGWKAGTRMCSLATASSPSRAGTSTTSRASSRPALANGAALCVLSRFTMPCITVAGRLCAHSVFTASS